MFLYALTVFAGAFLLFLLQPIVAKQILPWFGGSAAVWTTCLVFFQFLLFAGYAYADWSVRRLVSRRQVVLHLFLLGSSLFFLPIMPDAAWKPVGTEDPVWRILGLLAMTVGLPYFLLSTTGPLIQVWFARSFPAGTVYRLFALSNFASLLALLSYPVLIEPWLGTGLQSWGWSGIYAGFVVLFTASAVYSLRHTDTSAKRSGESCAAAVESPGLRKQGAWLLFSAMGTAMLMAVTNRLTQDLASVPFLWILPLALYLISFVLCFEGRGWYRQDAFIWLLLVSVVAMAWKLSGVAAPVAISLNLLGLFVMCMFFHGELAARKPGAGHLTRFYLMVSLGGALGGLAVAVLASRLFNATYEFSLGLVATLVIAAYALRRLRPAATLAAMTAIVLGAYYVLLYMEHLDQDNRLLARNFYGTLRITEVNGGSPREARLRLLHGATIHGEQYLSPERRGEATTYYGPTSGVGRAVRSLDCSGCRVGIIGLGTGTIASYGRPGDVYRFYEIDPKVFQVASRDFSFLRVGGARIEFVPGDARLAMEREMPQAYDLLVIDAFSSDSIPVHLLTREALSIYLRHLKPDGLIAFHVSNRYLKLAPVVKRLLQEQGWAATLIQDSAVGGSLLSSDWVLAAGEGKLLEAAGLTRAGVSIEDIPGLGVWTDDFNNLFRVLK